MTKVPIQARRHIGPGPAVMAMQYDGTEESLRALGDWLGLNEHEECYVTWLAVPGVDGPSDPIVYDGQGDYEHIFAGGWVITLPDRTTVMSDADFHTEYHT